MGKIKPCPLAVRVARIIGERASDGDWEPWLPTATAIVAALAPNSVGGKPVVDKIEEIRDAMISTLLLIGKSMTTDDVEALARAAYEVMASSDGVDLGDCELCSKPLRLGQFVNQYDDLGTAHANCDDPFAAPPEPTPTPADDGTTMTTYVLLGVPALLVDLDTQDVRELTQSERTAT